MAKILPTFATHSIFLFILLLSSPFTKIQVIGKESRGYARRLDTELMGLKKEKLTHFKVYWHDIQSGQNPTSVTVVAPPKISQTSGFGMVNMIDNPITEGPELSSKLVGKAQGFYALASQEEIDLLMAMNFAFMEGKYNGSGITVLGRNTVFSKVREMPVIGGSGLFRFARGYVQARTHTFDPKTGDAVVEYNVYVLHY